MIKWNFPSNNDGEVTGLNNAGIETFLGEPISSLAREVNQNSLDAADHMSGRPVEVHFQMESVSTDYFPDRENFLEILSSCRDYWSENNKARAFFENSIRLLSNETIKVMKISDYYTIGLTGSDKAKGSNWANLIKAVGASDKEGGAGGSFGIGKHAPFACSGLRTVFYSTKDIDGKIAFQGVSKLVTHTGADGRDTQGTGYFGASLKNEPVKNESDIPACFRRGLTGTDLFAFGFDGGDNWENEIVKSVLENFFVAIHQRKLIVSVGDTRIDDTTLPELMVRHFEANSESDCAKFYEAFTSDNKNFYALDDFYGLGGLELHILAKPQFPKRVAMVRQTGMLVFHKGHFQTPMKFAGVMRATGDKINEFLRSLEPPSHNKWEVERHADTIYAKRIVSELYKWVRECVKETSKMGIEAEYDFDGMQQFLPDDLEDEPARSPVVEGENSIPQEVEVVYRQPARASQPNEHQPSDISGGEGDDGTATAEPDETSDTDSTESEPGNQGSTGTDEGMDGASPKASGASAPSRIGIPFKKVRAFCSDPSSGAYRVIFQTQKDGEGFIQLRIVGEVEESVAPAIGATYGGEAIQIGHDGLIGPIPFLAGQSQELSVLLANQIHCALEVAAYENQ